MVTMRKRGEPEKRGTAPPPSTGAAAAPPVSHAAARPPSGDDPLIRLGADNARHINDLMADGAAALAALDSDFAAADKDHGQRIKEIPLEPSQLTQARAAFDMAVNKAHQVRKRAEYVSNGRAGRHAPIGLSNACSNVKVCATNVGKTHSKLARVGVKQRLIQLGAAYAVLEASWHADQDTRHKAELDRAKRTFDSIQQSIQKVQKDLSASLSEGLAAWNRVDAEGARAHPAWNDEAWRRLSLPTSVPPSVRIGTHEVTTPIGSAQQPALWKFPAGQSLLITPPTDQFTQNCPALLSILLRLVASMPRGSFQVKFLDPAGLGNNVAPLMQLREYDETLVDATVAVSESDIIDSLNDLISYVGHVNASYLKGKFATIEAHNQAAGEIAIPYRIAAVFGYPQNFSERSIAALCDIAESGAKAGVFVVALEQSGRAMPYGADDSRLRNAARSISVMSLPVYGPDGRAAGQRNVLADKDPDRRGVAFRFDKPIEFRVGETATDTVFGRIVDLVGAAARESRVRVVGINDLWAKFREAVQRNPALYDGVPPSPLLDDPSTWWKSDSTCGIDVPIGRVGATKYQRYSVVKHQHAHTMIIGGTGTGKSTLLHGMIAAIAATYSPDEVELTLVDMKDGVGFNIYATEGPLPHARTIAVKSDRAVALEVLNTLVGEMHRRNDLFGQETSRTGKSVTDIAEYRISSGAILPRHFCVIDEFHDLTGLEDQIGSAARDRIRTIAKEGRSAGIHLLLSSQNAIGAGLGPEILSEIAVRICFRVGSTAASEAALGDGNTAAVEDLPAGEAGVAIYNVDRMRSGNEIFKVALIGKETEVPSLVRQLAEMERARGSGRQLPRVFDGAHAAGLTANRDILSAFDMESFVAETTSRPATPAPAARVDVVARMGRRGASPDTEAADSAAPVPASGEPVRKFSLGRRRPDSTDSTDEPTEATAPEPETPPALPADGFGDVSRDTDGTFELDVDELMMIGGLDDVSPTPSAASATSEPKVAARTPSPVARSPKNGVRPSRSIPGFLGQPLSFATSLAVTLNRGSGGHLLYVGGTEAEVLGAFTGVALGTLSVCRDLITDRLPIITVLDQEVSDTATTYWRSLADQMGGFARYVDSLSSENAVEDLAAELAERVGRRSEEVALPHLVILYGGEQAHFLRSTDAGWDDSKPAFDKLISNGPGVGIHIAASFEGRRGATTGLGSGRLDDFGNRVASQISADDRAALLDDHTIKGSPIERPVLRTDNGAISAFIPFDPLRDETFLSSVVARCARG